MLLFPNMCLSMFYFISCDYSELFTRTGNKNIRPAQCLASETPFFIAALALSNLAAMY